MNFTVVIPTCNDRPEYLLEALRSVTRQTLPAAEILVVNNGKGPMASDNLPGSPRIVDIPTRAGAAQARNFGVTLAENEWVAFLDDDDWWDAGYLKAVADRIDRDSPECVVGRLDQSVEGAVGPFKNAADGMAIPVIMRENPGVVGSTTIVSRKAFFAVGGYDVSLPPSEDKSLVLEMLLRGMKVSGCPEAVAVMRQHAGERLTNPGGMVRGIGAFLDKYGERMTLSQRAFNRAKLRRWEYETRRTILNYCTMRASDLASRMLDLVER